LHAEEQPEELEKEDISNQETVVDPNSYLRMIKNQITIPVSSEECKT